MGFFSDVFGVNGLANAKPTLASVLPPGWCIDADHGGGKYEFHFNSSLYDKRRVLVNWGNYVASFALKSVAEFSSDDLTAQVGFAFLLRNTDVSLGAWDMRQLSNGNFGFVVSYTALIAGLDPTSLKTICEGLVEEATQVDGRLRSKGLI